MGRNATRPKHGKYLSRGSLLLRSWRTERGISLYEINVRVGLTYDGLTRCERGHNRPGLKIAVALQRLTGIAPREWLEQMTSEELEAFEALERTDDEEEDQSTAVA